MKVATTTVILALLASIQLIQTSEGHAQTLEDRDLQNGKNSGNGNGNGNGTGNGPPDFVLRKWKEKNQVKDNVNPKLQEVLSRGYFKIGNKEFSLKDEDLVPINIFTKNSQTAEDLVFTSKDDPNIIIARDDQGNLVAATRYDESTGSTTSVLPVGDGKTFATLKQEDYDEEELGKFLLDDDIPEGRKLLVEGEITMQDVVPPVNRNLRTKLGATSLDSRALQSVGDCSSYGYDIIELKIVADSDFCTSAGGTKSASEAKALAIIAQANQFYKVDGLCKELRLDLFNSQFFCNGNDSQAVQNMLNGVSGCSSLLDDFEVYVNGNNNIKSDATHLFFGDDDGSFGNVIGCANVNTFCRQNGSNTGVNKMSFSSSVVLQAQLFAHELGHNLNALHVSDAGDIMRSSLCGGCTNFGDTSKNSINNKVASTSCTDRETGGGGPPPTDPPTEAPTAVPTKAPTSAPTRAPVESPSGPTPTDPPTNGGGNCKDDDTFLIRFSNGYVTEGCTWLRGQWSGYKTYYCDQYWFFPAYCCDTCS